VGDFSELSVAPGADERHYFVLGSTPDCEAQVADVQVSASSVTNLECLAEDPRDPSGTNLRAPLAIATTADLVVVQVGNDLMVSHHGGNDFATVGPADEPSDAAS
jgi:hypothetical protein